MDIPQEVLKSVIFVGYKPHADKETVSATAFLLMRGGERLAFNYLVTARHVIDGIRNLGLDSIYIRVNTTSGDAAWKRTALKDWHNHPGGKQVDVAAASFTWSDDLQHLPYPIDGITTPEVISKYQIGTGNDVFIAGLFHPHHGKKNNIPIVRVGTIAAMPTEKVDTTLGPMDAYLIDTRAIHGLSGSPVFLAFGTTRSVGGILLNQFQKVYLLGLVHGQYIVKGEDLNLGIEIVVPVERIVETIKQPAIADEEKELENRAGRHGQRFRDRGLFL